jgi:hypothetical protein
MKYNTNKTMKTQLIIDIGPTLVTIDAGVGNYKETLLFTAYVNGISLRSTNLNLPAVRDRFIQCIWLMSGVDRELDTRHTHTMRRWITDQHETLAPAES